MGVKVFFVALVLIVHSYGNPMEEHQYHPRTRFIFGGPFSSGFQALSDVFSSGVSRQADVLRSGIQGTANQVNQFATDITQQTIDMVSRGKQLTKSAVEQISKTGLTAGAMVILGKFNYLLHATGQDTVTIDPITTSLGGFGTLETSKGVLSKLSTLRLDGNINVTAGLSGIRIAIPLTFDELGVSFENYDFSTWGISMNGNINAKIGNNSFVAHVVVQPGLGCQVNVERVEVTRIQDIDLQMTGLCSWCTSVAGYVASFLEGMITAEVQKAVDAGLRSVLTENSLVFCSVPGLS